MEMDSTTLEMARRFYGYGRWDAPYWFIGPEPGMALDEGSDQKRRVEAWHHFDVPELCDCRAFHEHIGQMQWHRDRPRLQPTWRPLMLLLMSILERCADTESLREYQRDRWGRLSGGETCVIELSGLAANNLKVPIDHKLFRQERVDVIRQRMATYKPRLVVMYGVSEKEHWQELADGDRAFLPDVILSRQSTLLVFTPHPTKHGLRNTYWSVLGERLRSKGVVPAENT